MGRKRRSRAFKENDQIIDFEEERRKRKEKRQQLSEKKKGRREPQPPVSGRRAGKKLKRRLIYCGVILAVVCVIGYSVYNVVTLRAERAKAEEAKLQLEKEKSKLEKELSLADSDEYIEEKARDELHMIRVGEKIYYLPEDENTSSASVVVQSATPAATSTNGALYVTTAGLEGEGDGEDWISVALTGIKDTCSAVWERLKSLVRK